jgi:hypothetical protein
MAARYRRGFDRGRMRGLEGCPMKRREVDARDLRMGTLIGVGLILLVLVVLAALG